MYVCMHTCIFLCVYRHARRQRMKLEGGPNEKILSRQPLRISEEDGGGCEP